MAITDPGSRPEKSTPGESPCLGGRDTTRIRVVVRSIEGEMALLGPEDRSSPLQVPARLLPLGTGEGSWLELSLCPDPRHREETLERIMKRYTSPRDRRQEDGE